jgi:F-type H+-transporting ATPase subunit b
MTFDWWTLGLQTVNVLILIWLLGRFFWRPVAAMIEERRARAESLLDQARAKRDAADAALAEITQRRAGFVQEGEAILREARAQAEQARAELLRQAEAEAGAVRAAAQASIEKDRDETERAWAEKAGDLAVSIAAKLATRLDGESVHAAFLHWLVARIEQLPEEVRKGVAAGLPLEAVAASPLDAVEQACAREAIGAAFGGRVEITFVSDPSLISGLELRSPHFILKNSWRADLDSILAELTHDQRN